MTLLGFVVLLIIAAIAGAVGQAIAGYSFGGFLMSIVVGLIGALIGWWLAGMLGLPELFVINIDGQPFPVVWSIIGSTLFALIVGLVGRRNVRAY